MKSRSVGWKQVFNKLKIIKNFTGRKKNEKMDE